MRGGGGDLPDHPLATQFNRPPSNGDILPAAMVVDYCRRCIGNLSLCPFSVCAIIELV